GERGPALACGRGTSGARGGRRPRVGGLPPPALPAVPLPAAALVFPSPGPVRRRDLPGARPQPVDEPVPQAGYLPAGWAGTHAPLNAGAAAPCFSPRRSPPPC